jgi:ADP-ribosylglycohydrolase
VLLWRRVVVITTADRIVGCLKGIAVGDAVGKQTETLSHADVCRWYPRGIRGFEGKPGSIIPRYKGNSKREWRIGETTDDTERTVAVARAIVADRAVSHVSIGREMLGCSKCVHPGVASLWEFHAAGVPSYVATRHDGCGAAVRVAPVGIFYTPARMTAIVKDAREASISTHGGALAIAAAAATAAAISAAIEGMTPGRVFEIAVRAAFDAERRWPAPAAASPIFAAHVRRVYDLLASLPEIRPADIVEYCFPNRPLTIVPLALALATLTRSAKDAILLAANVGGDSDSVASVAGGILGALAPGTVPSEWERVVERVNGDDLGTIAAELGALRH